jgi:hypothetical protein
MRTVNDLLTDPPEGGSIVQSVHCDKRDMTRHGIRTLVC